MRTFFFAAALCLSQAGVAETPAPAVEALLHEPLQDIKSHNVMMSRVSIPPGANIPPHFHPSEEFLYVIKGSMTLKIEEQADIHLQAGSAQKIPARAVHTGINHNEHSEIIVFRVHPKGKPVVLNPEEKQP